MFAPSAGYDRAITIFSPDGRLYQVEYALETVRRGSLAVGIRTKEGIVLAVEEKGRKLQSDDSVIKMFQIDDHVGAVGAGYIPDARIQVDSARVMAQSNKLIYDEPVDVEAIAKRIADMNQQYTQYAGVRPFGVSLIIAGVDENNGPVVYLADPTGTYSGFHAIAIGQGSDQVNDYLEKNYHAGHRMHLPRERGQDWHRTHQGRGRGCGVQEDEEAHRTRDKQERLERKDEVGQALFKELLGNRVRI